MASSASRILEDATHTLGRVLAPGNRHRRSVGYRADIRVLVVLQPSKFYRVLIADLSEGYMGVTAKMQIPDGTDASQRAQTAAACSQCRARKIKCDRLPESCSPCLQRELDCTYTQRHGRRDRTLPSPDGHADELSKAGVKRRRVRCACEPCRNVKARCTGGLPCDRCSKRSISCTQSHASAPQPRFQRMETPVVAGEASLLTPCTRMTQEVPASTSDTYAIVDVPEKELIKGFLERSNTAFCNILHGPTTLSQWSKGKLDTTLLRAICAVGLRSKYDSGAALTQAIAWMREVQASLLSRLEAFSMSRLQALILLVELHLDIGDRVEGWNLLAMAARAAFTLKLNHERPEMEPVVREMRRRAMWQIYLFDRMASGGLADLSVCASDRMLSLQLPCEDRTFERGMPSQAQTLVPPKESQQSYRDMDIAAYMIRIFYIRHKVLSYTKQVLKDRASPASSREDLHALEAELVAFGADLPSDLQLQPERLAFMAQSRDAHGYFMLHTIRLQCYCDLYRFLVPGIREAVSREVFDVVPTSFVSYCQSQCLLHAVELCNLWSSIHNLRQAKPIDSIFFVISVYQIAQILTQLQHLLTQDEFPHSAEGLRKSLTDAMAMISPRLCSRPSPISDVVQDTREFVEALGRARPLNLLWSRRGSPKGNALHMASKGSLIPRGDSSDSEQSSGREGDPSKQTATSMDPGYVPARPGDLSTLTGATDTLPSIADAVWPPQSLYNDEIADREASAELGPWAGFSVDLNDDYDVDLMSFGVYHT